MKNKGDLIVFSILTAILVLTVFMFFHQLGIKDRIAKQTAAVEEIADKVSFLHHILTDDKTEDLLFLKILILQPKIDLDLARSIAKSTHKYSTLYKCDPNLTLSVMYIESNFNPKATSVVGAQGLMQVMPVWKEKQNITCDLYDVDCGIHYGLQVLNFYRAEYGKDLEMALTAYNRGPRAVDFALSNDIDPRNGYASRIIKEYERLKNMGVRKEPALIGDTDGN